MEENEVTERVIGCFYNVYNALGYGFLEKVYERALAIEFEKVGLKFGRQVPVDVCYDGRVVGEHIADFIVENIVVEIKAIRELTECDGKQLLNYLRVTGNRVGLILNFGREAEIKRKIFG
jgi:GxxExxY protein